MDEDAQFGPISSVNETQLVAQDDPSHESQVEFSWRAEGIVSLESALF